MLRAARLVRAASGYASSRRRSSHRSCIWWNSTRWMKRSTAITRYRRASSLAMFTNSLSPGRDISKSSRQRCGIANINIGTQAVRRSAARSEAKRRLAGGRESGSDSWKAYNAAQTNTINWSSQLPLGRYRVRP